MRDFHKSLKSKASKPTPGTWSRWLWLGVVLFISAILVFSVYQFWTTRQQQTVSQRILLYHQFQPVAVVHVWPQERQIIVADLTQLAALTPPAQPVVNPTLFYSFALRTWFDRALSVDDVTVNQSMIIAVLQTESDLAHMVNDDRVWWRFEEWLKLQQRQQTTNFACPVAVINATQVAGLAGRVSEILDSGQFNVVRKDNYSQSQATSQLFYAANNTACQTIAVILADWAGVEQVAVEASDERLATYRSSMTLILGEDLIY